MSIYVILCEQANRLGNVPARKGPVELYDLLLWSQMVSNGCLVVAKHMHDGVRARSKRRFVV